MVMRMEVLPTRFSVCKVADFTGVDPDRPFTFTARTDGERSLVCPEGDVPSNTLERADEWRALRVCGQLDFSLVGILSRISSALADAGRMPGHRQRSRGCRALTAAASCPQK